MSILWLGLAIVAYYWLSVIWSRVVTDAHLNVAQAAIDASRCSILFDQVTEGGWDFESVCDTCVFDLPFVDFAAIPSSWWFAIWQWDFIGRQIVMEHSTNHMNVLWGEVEFDA